MANAKKLKVPVGGRLVNAEKVGYKILSEEWNKYKLNDGTEMRIKTVLTSVARTEDFDQQGDPVYYFTTSNIGSAIVPAKLKKKAS